MAESDKYTFRGAFSNLMRHSLKILAEEPVVGAVSGIHNYKARFDATIDKYEHIHRKYFSEIRDQYKEDILKGYEFDSWLLDNDIRVVFGSENPEASHKGMIMISAVYRASKECVKKATVKDDQIILYPQIYLLHLYRIFASLDSHDEPIHAQMMILENDLKSGTVGESTIKSLGLEFPANVPANVDPSDALKAMMNDPMLDNIFSIVTNSFAQSGMVPKEELAKISVNDIRKQFNNILHTDTLKRTFETMNRTLAGAKTPEEAMKLSMDLMNDPSLVEEFAKLG